MNSPNPWAVVDPLNIGGWNKRSQVDNTTGMFTPNGDIAGSGLTHPNFVQGYDPATMSLSDYLTGHYDDSALKAYKDQAMRTGPSQWANLAQASNRANEASSREAGTQQVAGQTAQAEDRLAGSGGLSSGARERAGMEGTKNYLNMSQGLAREGNLNSMQIGMNDEQNRIQQLSQLPGMEAQKAGMFEQAKAGDVSNIMAANNNLNQYNQNLYNQQMNAWGASKQADATANAGKHGFLGTQK